MVHPDDVQPQHLRDLISSKALPDSSVSDSSVLRRQARRPSEELSGGIQTPVRRQKWAISGAGYRRNASTNMLYIPER
jgi:hypothetical protein